MRISSVVIISTLCTHLTTVASAQTEIVATEHLPGRVVEVDAGEFFLRAPDTISAGLVTLRLRQIGDLLTDRAKVEAENLAPATPDNDPTRAFHMLWVVKLEPGHTMSEWYAAHVRGDPTPWAVDMGGPSAAEPPLSANASMVLEPGNYVLVCHVGSARADKSRSHLLKGMFRSLTVVPSGTPVTELPPADVIAYITGTGQVRIQGTVRSGRQSIMVINEAPKSFEFMVYRLKAGRTAEEAVSWRRVDGKPQPFSSQGGLSEIPSGARRLTTIEFESGDYVVWTVRSPATSVAVTVPKR
jgi:hypothetical protein